MAQESEAVDNSLSAGLRIGPWRVQRSLNQLEQGARTVHLEPKVMEVLVYLAARPGQVVGRDALLTAVWPGVVVGEDALTNAIIKLRKALGDTARKPVFIETIAKRGYRLIAPVATVVAEPSGPGRRDPAPRPRARRRKRMAASAAIMFLACIGVGTALVLDRSASVPAPPAVPDWSQLAARTTIAVQPFSVIGDDPQHAVLARGLVADLMTDLGRVQGLTVLSGARPTRAGDGAPGSLAPRYVVSGTVQRVADRLRVNIGLIDGRSGQQLWSERFERPAGDLSAVQDEIAARIVAQLPLTISAADRRRAAQRYTRSIEAFELFHEGEVAFWAWQPDQNEIARTAYRRAIALDPAFGRAYAALAMTYALEHRFRWGAEPDRALGKAFELVATARRFGPETPELLFAVAWVHAQGREHAQALQLLEAALRLNPSFANAYSVMGFSLMEMGRPAEALPSLTTAMRLTVHPGYHQHAALGKAYFYLGDAAQAIAHLESAVAQNPANIEAHAYLAATLARAGRREEAAWHVDEIRALRPDFDLASWLESYPLTHGDQRDQLQTALAKAGL